MKRIFALLAACAAVFTVAAQVPVPGWDLSDMIERQCGVENYTYEKFDFDRLPTTRHITEFLSLTDTLAYKPRIFHATISDADGPVTLFTFQQPPPR